MVEIDIHNNIASEESGIFLSMFGLENEVFSLEKVRDIFEQNEDEKDFKFNIHCNGGSVSEGLVIYDTIRNSGKNIYTNIEGSCHSMAITLLLAAPKENRTANPNSRALVHEVRGEMFGTVTTSDVEGIAEDFKKDQDAILDIYADRTGYDRTELEALMKSEKELTVKELQEYGFISKVNNYNTNLKTDKMSEVKKLNTKLDKVLKTLGNFIGEKNSVDEPAINEYKNDSEEVVFTYTNLEVGADVTAENKIEDETFNINGQEVVIKDNKIEAINEKDEKQERINELEAELATLKENVNESETTINAQNQAMKDAHELITELKNEAKSTHKVAERTTLPKEKENVNAEVIRKANEKYEQFKNKK